MYEKKLGYIIVATGVLTMFFSAFQITNVFIGGRNPVSFFNAKDFSEESVDKTMQSSLSDNISENIKNSLFNVLNQTQQTALIPIETLYEMLNLVLFYFLMHFLLNFGFKIANLGILLIKTNEK